MSRFRRLIGPVRPALHDEVDSVVAPTYARRDDVERELADVRRVVADSIEGSAEAATVLGRTLSAMAARLEALEVEVERLRDERAAR